MKTPDHVEEVYEKESIDKKNEATIETKTSIAVSLQGGPDKEYIVSNSIFPGLSCIRYILFLRIENYVRII